MRENIKSLNNHGGRKLTYRSLYKYNSKHYNYIIRLILYGKN